MKKMAIWALAALTMFVISCDKNNDSKEGEVELTSSALVGKWTISSEDFTDTWEFTSDKLTKTEGWSKTEGTYKVENGTIAYTITKAWYKDGDNWKERELNDEEKIVLYAQAKLIYKGSVLIINFVVDESSSAPHHNPEDTSYFLYKVGGSISPDTKPLQGTWDWYMFGTNKTEIRIRLIFSGNNFELITTPWSEKYTGTYTYRSGYVTCTVTAAYSGRNPEGEGFGEGDIDPSTLEGTWYPYENLEDAYYYSHGLIFPFIADGNVAYGLMANLFSKFEKQ
jgi:hypothetical protein